MLAIILAAYLPPAGLHYAGRTEYAGPGLVCGAAFSIRLEAGERATLLKRSFTDAVTTFTVRQGKFTVKETPYGTAAGTIVRKYRDGILSRERVSGRYIWHYTDSAPGSTDLYGPSIGATIANSPLSRIDLGSPRNGFVRGRKCLDGNASDPRIS